MVAHPAVVPGMTSPHPATGADAYRHEPVLLDAVLHAAPTDPRLILDCTLGGGGHAAALLERFPQAELLGCDRDASAVAAARERLAPHAERTLLKQLAFSELGHHVLVDSVDLLLADVGASSPQLDDAARGFSFTREGPLDMRMDPARTKDSAADLVNTARPEELVRILRTYGEERFAPRIVQAIVDARSRAPLSTTTELARLVEGVLPARLRKPGFHPATRTFQALRIAVNDEIGELERLLTVAPHLLRPGGRMVVISFHSLEDRLVKDTFRTWAEPCVCPPDLPACACGRKALGHPLQRKPVTAEPAETRRNPRSRSAKLRAFAYEPEPGAETVYPGAVEALEAP